MAFSRFQELRIHKRNRVHSGLTLRTVFFLLLLGFEFSNLSVSAKQVNLDSLWSVWNNESEKDSIRLWALQDIAWSGYLFSQADSAFYFAQQAYDLAERRGYKNHMAMALNTQATAIYLGGDHTEALDYFHRGLSIAEEIGEKRQIARLLNNIGGIYQSQGDKVRALNHYKRSLKICEEINYTRGIGGILNNLGNLYRALDQDSIAMVYFEKSWVYAEENDNTVGMANTANNIGIVHQEQNKLDKALEYFELSIALNQEANDQIGLAEPLNNAGLVYSEKGDYQTSLDYYFRSLEITEEAEYKLGILKSLNSIGNVYLTQSKLNESLEYCQKAYDLGKDGVLYIELKNSCSCLYKVYKAMGDGDEALKYHELTQQFEDSLFKDEARSKLQLMEFQKQVLQDSIERAEEIRVAGEYYENEIESEKRTIVIVVVGGVIVLILAGAIYSRLRYTQRSKAMLKKEKDRSENLLLNILPEEIAEELKIHGKADARDFDMVSILFSDFKGFTQQSEKLSAVQLVKEIDICFEAFDGIMEKYGIEKIKTIGDSYMAAGGLPVPNDESVKNTVLAGLEIQAFINARYERKKAKGEQAFQMRVGIHTGPVVAGIVGVKKFQYDIWGDTVNTASRMESSGEVGKVNISQATYELLKDLPDGQAGDAGFTFKSRGLIEAKGKGEMNMYFVSLG